MQRYVLSRVPLTEWLLLGFLLFSVLWRGGKSLETTWMLVGVASMLTIVEWMRSRQETGSEQLEGSNDLGVWSFGMGFLFWTILSYVFSTTNNYGLDEVLRDGAFLLVFFWTVRHARGESGAPFLHRCIQTITTVAILGALFGCLVYAMQPVNRFVGTFFDHRFHTDYWPNAWAQFVLLAWPMMILWMRGQQGSLRACPELCRRVAGCGFLGIVLGTLLLSYSRGAMIAFAGQIILLAVLQWKHRPAVEWKILFAKIAVIAGTAIAVFFLANAVRSEFHSVQSVGEKITFTADEGGSSVDERRQFWTQAFSLTLDRPLFGWGPYSFRFVQQRLQTGVLQTSDHPHNVFLKLAAERGVPALLLFGAMLVTVLFPYVCSFARLFVCSRETDFEQTNKRTNGSSHDAVTLLTVSILGVLAHNLIDYNLQFVGIALPFWIMLGVLASRNAQSLPTVRAGTKHKANILSKKIVQKFELALAVLLLTIAFREGVFLVTSSIGRHAEARRDTEKALQWYNRSTPEWFSRDMHLSRALLATSLGATESAQRAMDIFLKGNTEDPRGWRLQGDIALEVGDLPGAIDAYAKAYERGRWNDLSITLALVETLNEREKGVRSNEKLLLEQMKPEIDALLSSFVEAIVRNAHFVALSHNAEDAIALAALLAKVFPDSAPRYEVLAARADFAMRTERAKVKSRPAGYLW